MELSVSIFHLPVNSALVFISITLFVWFCLQDSFSYWSKRGVPQVSFFKCLRLRLAHLLHLKHNVEVYSDLYESLDGCSYGGSFNLFRPDIVIRDPAILKPWLVKGFENFHDHASNTAPDEDGKNLTGELFALTGEKWRTVRTAVVPAFSSMQLKFMYQTLNGCIEELRNHLGDLCSKAGGSSCQVDVRDLTNRYAMDVIGACALGIKCNAIQDPDNCEVRKFSKQVLCTSWRASLHQVLELVHPKLPVLVGWANKPAEVTNFMTSLTKQAMDLKAREGRPGKDFLQILMDANSSTEKKGKKSSMNHVDETTEEEEEEGGFKITEDFVAGIIASFLWSGLEPISSLMTYCLYELAYHPDIQDKIFEEIQAIKNTLYHEIAYEDLRECHYLEQVIKETLRKHPPLGPFSRKCTKPYEIPNTSIIIEKGVTLMIPNQNIHHDPKYFPEPNKFDPDRFSKENIDKIVPGSFLPFGEGPRFCIAKRLVLMDVKTMLIALLSDYTLHPCAKTRNQLEINRLTFHRSPKYEVYLQLKRRS